MPPKARNLKLETVRQAYNDEQLTTRKAHIFSQVTLGWRNIPENLKQHALGVIIGGIYSEENGERTELCIGFLYSGVTNPTYFSVEFIQDGRCFRTEFAEIKQIYGGYTDVVTTGVRELYANVLTAVDPTEVGIFFPKEVIDNLKFTDERLGEHSDFSFTWMPNTD